MGCMITIPQENTSTPELPRLNLLDLFDCEPVVDALATFVMEVSKVKIQPYTHLTLRTKPKNNAPGINFASTCRVVHKNMARYLFKEVRLTTKKEAKNLPFWHPDALAYIRTLIFDNPMYLNIPWQRFYASLPRLETIEYPHLSMQQQANLPPPSRFGKCATVTKLMTAYSDPMLLQRYLATFPNLEAVSLKSTATIQDKRHLLRWQIQLPKVTQLAFEYFSVPYNRWGSMTPTTAGFPTDTCSWPLHYMFPNVKDIHLLSGFVHCMDQENGCIHMLSRLFDLEQAVLVQDVTQLPPPMRARFSAALTKNRLEWMKQAASIISQEQSKYHARGQPGQAQHSLRKLVSIEIDLVEHYPVAIYNLIAFTATVDKDGVLTYEAMPSVKCPIANLGKRFQRFESWRLLGEVQAQSVQE